MHACMHHARTRARARTTHTYIYIHIIINKENKIIKLLIRKT